MRLVKTKTGYDFNGEADMILSHNQERVVELKGFENTSVHHFYLEPISLRFIERLRLSIRAIKYIFCRKS